MMPVNARTQMLIHQPKDLWTLCPIGKGQIGVLIITYPMCLNEPSAIWSLAGVPQYLAVEKDVPLKCLVDDR